MIRAPVRFAVALVFAAPLAAHARPDPAFAAYRTALARQCAVKHLGWLNPGILADPVEDFLATLPRHQRAIADRVAATECANAGGGAACTNMAAIHAAVKLKVVYRLATVVCRQEYICTGPDQCRTTER